MPQMADITVKKADGTTDVIYVRSMASAGDKMPARWTQDAYSGVQGLRPLFELQTQNNGDATVRQAKNRFQYPILYTDASTGLLRLQKTIGFEGISYLPRDVTTLQWKEAWAQYGNILCSTLVRACIEEGYAPT